MIMNETIDTVIGSKKKAERFLKNWMGDAQKVAANTNNPDKQIEATVAAILLKVVKSIPPKDLEAAAVAEIEKAS